MDTGNMKSLYGDLYDVFAGKESGSRTKKEQMYADMFTKIIARPILTTFTTIEGKKYKDKEKKFMLVGRANNGWDELRVFTDYDWCREHSDIISKDDFVSDSMMNLENGNYQGGSADRFSWIGTAPEDGSAPNNCFREGIDAAKSFVEGNPYSLSRPFWGYSKDVYCKVIEDDDYNPNDAWVDRWFDNIVWSNLYKVAPTSGWNPDEKLKQIQFDACLAILKEEIALFKPNYIFFVTGYKEWFDAFDGKLFETKLRNGGQAGNKYVEACGTVMIGEEPCHVVVAARPEQRPKEEYVREVVAAFNSMSLYK